MIWRRTVFPLVSDRETSVQDRCLEAVTTIILDRVLKDDSRIWDLLQDLDAENCRYIHRVCTLLVRKKALPDGLIKKLMKAITNEEKQVLMLTF